MEMAWEQRKAAQGGVQPPSPWQAAEPSMCYGALGPLQSHAQGGHGRLLPVSAVGKT
jgi:hypothetical protein